MQFKRVGIAADHAGRELKRMIVDYLKATEVAVTDYGVDDNQEKSVDYPDFAELIALNLTKGTIDGGIVICGTGIGMAMVANKFAQVRAAVAWDEYSARLGRSHNDANVLALGARCLNFHRATDLVNIWLTTPFAGERHELRLRKIREIEKRNFKLQ